MRKLVAVSCAAAALLAAGGDAHAQGLLPFAVEARGGFAVPQGDWRDDAGVDGGFGYGINARLQLMPLISFYGGWETYSFDMDAEDSETTDAGLRAGAQLSLPLAALTGLSPYAFAGVIYNRTKMEFGEGVSVEFESDDGFGWEAGGGVSIPFAPTLSFTPGVRYRTHSADFSASEDFEGDDLTVSYIVVDLGLKLGL
jgi:opacity protein-like surface antigen